jgi:splicing factor 3B subunit 4
MAHLERDQRNQEATLWVGNLDPAVTEELVWELFLQCGPVKSVFMPRDKITNSMQGYSFVEFQSADDAEYAISIMNNVKLYGKPIRVTKSARDDPKDTAITANLFVGGLDREVDEKLLLDTFASFGTVVSARVMYDSTTGEHKGFGFVKYDTFEAADAAIAALNGQFIANRPISVTYAFKEGSRTERHGSAAERLLAANRAARGLKLPAATPLGFAPPPPTLPAAAAAAAPAQPLAPPPLPLPLPLPMAPVPPMPVVMPPPPPPLPAGYPGMAGMPQPPLMPPPPQHTLPLPFGSVMGPPQPAPLGAPFFPPPQPPLAALRPPPFPAFLPPPPPAPR